MAGITLSQAQTILDQYVAAQSSISNAQSYTIAGPDGYRTFTFADITEVEAAILKWSRIVNELSRPSGRGARMRRVTPL